MSSGTSVLTQRPSALSSRRVKTQVLPSNTCSAVSPTLKHQDNVSNGGDAAAYRRVYDSDQSPSAATSDSKLIRPKLIINVQMRDGVVVDASLAPASRDLLQGIARELFPKKPGPENNNEIPPQTDSPADPSVEKSTASPQSQGTTVVEVPLVFDGEFFGMLQGDVDRLDVLQAQEGSRMVAEIEALGKEVSLACRTKRFHRNDLERWRRIFELYLDAEVFFATHEQDHGARSSPAALRQLQWFQAEVEKHRLVKNFKLRESKIAFDRFLKLNVVLLKSLQFQELNKLAVYKILKSKTPPPHVLHMAKTKTTRVRQENSSRSC